MNIWFNIKKVFLTWFGDILIYPYPMFIMFGHTSYEMKGEDVRKVINTLQPGDILLRRYNHYISGLMIPGYFTHAAIYIGDNKVIHMLGKGIDKQDILTFCRCDDLAIIHCDEEQISKAAIKKAVSLYKEDIKYDYDFDFSDDVNMSCTEIINYIYKNPKMDRKKKYIIPDDYLTLDESTFTITYRKG